MALEIWSRDALGSWEAVIGLPITKKFAPSLIAWEGVTILFWSLISPPKGLIPGVTNSKSLPTSSLITFNSFAELTNPPKPVSFANLAKRITWSWTLPLIPSDRKSFLSKLVSTDTQKRLFITYRKFIQTIY